MENNITGVILAGGQARRMGGNDKGLIEVAGRPLIEYVIDALKPQVNSLIINANRNLSSYMEYGIPVIIDSISGYQGPLAGMASCMRVIETEFMFTAPCDTPRIPEDLVNRLLVNLDNNQADICVAHDGKYMQSVFALVKVKLLDSLLDFLNRDERKLSIWYNEHKMVKVDFSDKPETFINVNTPEDIKHIEAIIKSENSDLD